MKPFLNNTLPFIVSCLLVIFIAILFVYSFGPYLLAWWWGPVPVAHQLPPPMRTDMVQRATSSPQVPPPPPQVSGGNSGGSKREPPPLPTGSFTELFSGTGWKNEGNSTAYQDTKTTMISLAPKYEVKGIDSLASALRGETLLAARGNGREVVVVTAEGDVLTFQNEASVLRASLGVPELSRAALDYSAESGVWAVIGENQDGMFVKIIAVGGSGITVAGSAAIPGTGATYPIAFGISCAETGCLASTPHGIYAISPKNNSSLTVPDRRFDALVENKNLAPLSVGSGLNSWLAGIVEKKGNKFEGKVVVLAPGGAGLSAEENIFANPFASPYAGTIIFGRNSATTEVMALYGAYMGQAYVFDAGVSARPIPVTDFSYVFNQRVMEGVGAGDVGFFPAITGGEGAWLVSGEAGSRVPKLLRIESGAGSDLTDAVLPDATQALVVRGLRTREWYIFASSGTENRVLRFTDLGFEQGAPGVWESARLNAKGSVPKAMIRKTKEGGAVRYALSNDGGATWADAVPGKEVVFAKQGNDFRFRATLSPSGGQFVSPWVRFMNVEYSITE